MFSYNFCLKRPWRSVSFFSQTQRVVRLQQTDWNNSKTFKIFSVSNVNVKLIMEAKQRDRFRPTGHITTGMIHLGPTRASCSHPIKARPEPSFYWLSQVFFVTSTYVLYANPCSVLLAVNWDILLRGDKMTYASKWTDQMPKITGYNQNSSCIRKKYQLVGNSWPTMNTIFHYQFDIYPQFSTY